MKGSWTEYAVLWTNSLGFIWDMWKGYKIYKSWVWAQSWRSNLVLLGGYVFGIGF